MQNPPSMMPTDLIKKEALESQNRSDDDNSDDEGKKKRIYNKKTNEKIKRWTKEEGQRYDKFIEMHMEIFSDTNKKKRGTKIFLKMSKFIGTKTPSQCRSHHQKFYKKKFPQDSGFYPFPKCEDLTGGQSGGAQQGGLNNFNNNNNNEAPAVNQSSTEGNSFPGGGREKVEEAGGDDSKKKQKNQKKEKNLKYKKTNKSQLRPMDPMVYPPMMMPKPMDGMVPIFDDPQFDPNYPGLGYPHGFYPPNFPYHANPFFMGPGSRSNFLSSGQNPMGDPTMDGSHPGGFLDPNNNGLNGDFGMFSSFPFNKDGGVGGNNMNSALMGGNPGMGPNSFLLQPPVGGLGNDDDTYNERKKSIEDDSHWNNCSFMNQLDSLEKQLKKIFKYVDDSLKSNFQEEALV